MWMSMMDDTLVSKTSEQIKSSFTGWRNVSPSLLSSMQDIIPRDLLLQEPFRSSNGIHGLHIASHSCCVLIPDTDFENNLSKDGPFFVEGRGGGEGWAIFWGKKLFSLSCSRTFFQVKHRTWLEESNFFDFSPWIPLHNVFSALFVVREICFGNCPTSPPSKNSDLSLDRLLLLHNEYFLGNFWLFIVLVTCSDTKSPRGSRGDAPAVSKWWRQQRVPWTRSWEDWRNLLMRYVS